MADIKKTVQKSKTDDARRVETHVEEAVNGAATERVTTVREEVVPMAVKKVVREKIVPVVASRVIESYDDQGNVVDTQHEVVDDEAMSLKGYERDAIVKAVEDAIKRSGLGDLNGLPRVEDLEDEPDTARKPKTAPKSALKLIEERNEPAKSVKPASGGIEIDSSLLLYAVVAIEAALIVYMTVLKGWLLN